LAVTVYGNGRRIFPQKTPANFIQVYGPHWIDFPRYRGSPLYSQADIQLQAMVATKKVSRRRFIASDVEIKRILDILGPGFTAAFGAYGFTVSCAAMLGMHLFEVCVYDTGFNWWYKIPKSLRGIGHFEHSEYHL
jgi:hypothetical protein